MKSRELALSGLRGRAWAKSSDLTVDVEMAVRAPDRVRAELTGPLGVRVGLLVLGEKWMQLYVPREKTVFRFPSDELARDTLRRERFFRLIPFRADPALFVDGVLTRSGLGAAGTEVVRCSYDSARNAFEVAYRGPGGAGRRVRLDPDSGAPLELFHFARGLPAAPEQESRPDWTIAFSEFNGQGLATLPTHIEFKSAQDYRLSFEWTAAEAWNGGDKQTFEWDPPAGMAIRDY